jgi:ATP-dependent RNA helicase DeaD
LVLVPTRELAIQVAEATHRYGRELGARVLAIYGGQPIVRQIRALESGVDVVVATPGRAIDHLTRRTVSFDELRTVVLDEADEMLDMGFAEDIESIMSAVPNDRQTVLFSATLPARIDGLVRRYLKDPVKVRIHRERTDAETARVRQVAYLVPRQHKASALGRILDVESPTAAVVFCRTREEVDSLGETLAARGYRAEALHGGMTQDQRDRVMSRVRNKSAELLVATDVAARGLDIDHLTHVVNYDLPSAPDAYVHRIGRVGRAGREGVAITLVEPRQHRLLKAIEKATKQKISVESLPTVADLSARRLELTRAALQDALAEDGENERFRVVVENLTDEYDLMEIALAAVKLAHESTGADDDDAEIPQVSAAPAEEGSSGPRRRAQPGTTTTIFVSLGHLAKIRPQDLVGAIANETSLSGKQIGAIEITHKYSTVEIPKSAEAEVIAALSATLIKGRKARVERYKPPSERPYKKREPKQ